MSSLRTKNSISDTQIPPSPTCSVHERQIKHGPSSPAQRRRPIMKEPTQQWRKRKKTKAREKPNPGALFALVLITTVCCTCHEQSTCQSTTQGRSTA